MESVVGVIFIIFAFIAIAFSMFGVAKNENTYRNQMKIANAIRDYGSDMIRNGRYDSIMVSYRDIEPYIATYARWWDWGYTRILPPEKFEIIKPHISK